MQIQCVYKVLELVKKSNLQYPLLIKRDDISNSKEQLLNHLMIKIVNPEALRKVFEGQLCDIE